MLRIITTKRLRALEERADDLERANRMLCEQRDRYRENWHLQVPVPGARNEQGRPQLRAVRTIGPFPSDAMPGLGAAFADPATWTPPAPHIDDAAPCSSEPSSTDAGEAA